MDRLPLELLLLISSMTDKEDLPNFRLVSRSFASAGMRYLSIGGQIVFRRHSFKRLRNIAEHPIMSRRLTDLKFMLDMVPRFQDQENWESQACAICHGPWKSDPVALDWLRFQQIDISSPVKNHIKRFRDLGWQYQQKVRDEQEIMLGNSKNTFRLLKKSLARLPNLRNLVIDCYDVGFEKINRPLSVIKDDQAWYCYNIFLDENSSDLISRHLSSTVSAAHTLCHSQVNSASPLISLHMSTSDFLESRYGPGLLTNLAMLRNVQHLFLSSMEAQGYAADDVDAWDDSAELESVLGCSLGSMQDLSTLVLDIISQPRLKLDTIVKKQYWSRLASLQLAYLDINQNLFQEFLTLHSKTLISIQLAACNLEPNHTEGYAWIQVLMFMRDELNLSSLTFGGDLFEQDRIGFDTAAYAEIDDEQIFHVSEMAQWFVCGAASYQHIPGDDRDFEQVTWADLKVAYEQDEYAEL